MSSLVTTATAAAAPPRVSSVLETEVTSTLISSSTLSLFRSSIEVVCTPAATAGIDKRHRTCVGPFAKHGKREPGIRVAWVCMQAHPNRDGGTNRDKGLKSRIPSFRSIAG
jgi:hypothetical protein